MMMKSNKIGTAILHSLALTALMTAITPLRAQTLLEEDFSSGFEEWTVVHPSGAFNGSTR